MAIGLRIRELRRNMGLSQKELAFLLGKQPHVLCKIEKGKRRITGEELAVFARILDISVSDLLDEKTTTQ